MADTSPAALHARAAQLWQQEAHPDPRSAAFELAERHATTGTGAAERVTLRAEKWVAALQRYEGFWRDHGTRPRENTRNLATLPPAERRLGEWARYQRRFGDRLCRYQIIRLDVSPVFAWDPLERDWLDHLDACHAHVRDTGRLPYLNGSNRTEFQQARWLARQLHLLKDGRLPGDRNAKLGALLASVHPRNDGSDSNEV